MVSDSGAVFATCYLAALLRRVDLVGHAQLGALDDRKAVGLRRLGRFARYVRLPLITGHRGKAPPALRRRAASSAVRC